jgi:hypothetical protein
MELELANCLLFWNNMKNYPLSSNCCIWIFVAARMFSFKAIKKFGPHRK